jgi:hypothetical protein
MSTHCACEDAATEIAAALKDARRAMFEAKAVWERPLTHMLYYEDCRYTCDEDGAERFVGARCSACVPRTAVRWKKAPRDAEHARGPVLALLLRETHEDYFETRVSRAGLEVLESEFVEVTVPEGTVVRPEEAAFDYAPLAKRARDLADMIEGVDVVAVLAEVSRQCATGITPLF